ncbi:MAG: hypothetical protein WCO44_02110 [Bacteroidota bacterium]
MNRKITAIYSIARIVFLAIAMVASAESFAQKKTAAMRIGTFDSRIITFAWSRTDFLKQQMIRISQQSDSATKAHDTAKLKEVSVGAISFQHLLHLMVFSNGSAAWIMSLIKDKLPELARAEGVSVILSKWEVTFSDPSVEIVDLTAKVAQLFNPGENIDKMAAEISKQEPIPLREFSIENEMLDGYCARFGKK